MASARSYDLDGRLRVDLAVISKAGVAKYWGDEVADGSKLGLDPGALYWLYRPPSELMKAVPTCVGLPVLTRHEAVSALEYAPDLLVGATLSDARFEPPHLLCSIAIWSAEAIADIESGKKGALSAGYRNTPIMKSGVSPEGERYDGIMRDIALNHVALCDVGRIGPDAIIADRSPTGE